MKRCLTFLCLLGLTGGVLFLSQQEAARPLATRSTPPDASSRARLAEVVATVLPAPGKPEEVESPTLLLGEKILRGYADPAQPPEHDLELMARLTGNFLLLVKSSAARPLSANEDWAAVLRGKNPARERFLPDDHVAFDAQGSVVDRWGTPLFFHAMGSGRFAIRSAGPDRRLWTPDDLQRDADGSAPSADTLNPPSLADASRSRSSPPNGDLH